MLTLCAAPVFGQFTSGTSFYIKSQTQIAIDGLTIKPSSDLNFSDKTLLLSHTPVSGGIKRLYSFNQAFTFSGVMGLYYLDGEMNGNNEAGLQIATSSTPVNGLTVSSGSIVDLIRNYLSNTLGNITVSIVSAANSGGPLPVTLVEFKVAKTENSALLTWKTASELDSDFFEIQQSQNGNSWNVLGKVSANGMRSTYSFRQENPAPGENIYRLRMVDKDGSFSYSSLRSVNFDGDATVAIYPNPVAGKLKIAVNDWNNIERIQIMSAAGQTIEDMLRTRLKQLKDTGIAVENMKPGLYLVRVFQSDGSNVTLKMLKQ